MNKRLTSWLSTSNWQSLGHGRHAANKEIGFINIKAGISTMKHFEIITKSVSRALIMLLMFGFAFCSNAAVESITYITTDHLGSPIMATDHSGAVKWREDYLPYGSQIVKEDTDNSVGFTGHLDEKTLNVTYMQGRWYHPEMGRFLAVDPVGFVESSPMSFNRYAYVNNNPYKYVDPDGRYLDLAVEALSISVGIASLVDNYSRGDYSAAIVDAGGILVDSVLMAVPIFPGASGLGIKATRDGAQIVTKSGAESAKQAANLKEHLRQAEKYGQGGVKELPNGRTRYYGETVPAKTQGEMAGRRTVREWDPATGNKRTWHETLDHDGNVRQVRPEFNDGTKTHYTFDKNGNYSGSW